MKKLFLSLFFSITAGIFFCFSSTLSTDTAGFSALGDSVILNIYNNPVKALTLAKKRLELAEKADDSLMKGAAYSQMADVFTRLKVFDSAIVYAFKAVSIFERKGDKQFLAYNFNSIADIYTRQKALYPKAMEFYRKALSLNKAIGDSVETGGSLMNIAYLFSEMNEQDSAIRYLLKAIKINKQTGNLNYLIAGYDNLGQVYGEKGDYKKAMSCFKQNEPLLKDFNNDLFWAGHYYLMLPVLEKTGNYRAVIDTAKKGLQYAVKAHDWEMISEFYQALSGALEKQGNYKQSNFYLHKSDSLNAILSDDQMKTKLARANALYQLQNMQNQLIIMKEKNKTERLTRSLLLAIIFIVLVIFSFIIIWISKKRKNERKLFKYKTLLHEEKKKLMQSELEQKKLHEKELQKELEFKTRQLTTTALNIVQKNKALNELSEKLRETSKKASPDVKRELQKFRKAIDISVKQDKDWDIFKLHFEQVHPDFFERLKKINPELTTNDLRNSAFIRLRLSIKESAAILNLSPLSVKTARYKLRKKLKLDTNTDLYEFIANI